MQKTLIQYKEVDVQAAAPRSNMTLDDEIIRFAQEFLQSINEIDFSPTFPEIEQIILNSIDRNFREGNVITIDVGSNKVYARIHQLGGTIDHPGGTPYVIEWNKDLNKPWARFISKKQAARIESSKGSKLKGKVKYTQPLKIDIEARPYLVLKEEDVEAIRKIIIIYIIRVFIK